MPGSLVELEGMSLSAWIWAGRCQPAAVPQNSSWTRLIYQDKETAWLDELESWAGEGLGASSGNGACRMEQGVLGARGLPGEQRLLLGHGWAADGHGEGLCTRIYKGGRLLSRGCVP